MFPNTSLAVLSISHLKNIQPSYDFICKFASCGGAFDENRNDPGHSLTEEETSSTTWYKERGQLQYGDKNSIEKIIIKSM